MDLDGRAPVRSCRTILGRADSMVYRRSDRMKTWHWSDHAAHDMNKSKIPPANRSGIRPTTTPIIPRDFGYHETVAFRISSYQATLLGFWHSNSGTYYDSDLGISRLYIIFYVKETLISEAGNDWRDGFIRINNEARTGRRWDKRVSNPFFHHEAVPAFDTRERKICN